MWQKLCDCYLEHMALHYNFELELDAIILNMANVRGIFNPAFGGTGDRNGCLAMQGILVNGLWTTDNFRFIALYRSIGSKHTTALEPFRNWIMEHWGILWRTRSTHCIL